MTPSSIELTERYIVGNYARFPVAFARGEGRRLYDETGKSYLDMFSGLGVSCLGHGHVGLTEAIVHQAATLLHTSNLYYHAPAAGLAKTLCDRTFAERVFFCNSGAEAVEAAIKLARRAAGERHRIIATHGSFHGRTLGALAATGQPDLREGFGPMPGGFTHVAYADYDAVAEAVDKTTAAVLVEPIMGEGGVVVPPESYLRDLRELCDREGLLLILDEVQTGMGRTGTLYAYEREEARPDILISAKGLAGGLPVGAVLTTEAIARAFTPGSHGTTFGANPVVCAAASAVLEAFDSEDILANCRDSGEHLLAGLRKIAECRDDVKEVRGRGLMIAIELSGPARPIVDRALEHGLVINATAGTVLRFLPPLNITKEEIDEGLSILEEVLP